MTTRTGRDQGPLSGLRVLDLSAYIAGPYGCALLADQGAEVIKIEPPTGDNLRKYPSTLEAESRAFLGVNRSKLGVVLDLKKGGDLSALFALVRTADVLVHNFRPSVAPRLGIAYEQLEPLNPRLIYCAVTGYGETGPLKDKAGYDQVLQAMTGMCVMQGKARRAARDRLRLGGGLLRGARSWRPGCRRPSSSASAVAGDSRSAFRCCAARWPCSPRAWSGPTGEPRDDRPRHALGRHHRAASDTARLPLHLGEHGAFLEGALRQDRLAATGSRRALRHGAQARTAPGRGGAPPAPGLAGPDRPGMGSLVRRRGALRRGADNRGHDGGSAGPGTRAGRANTTIPEWVGIGGSASRWSSAARRRRSRSRRLCSASTRRRCLTILRCRRGRRPPIRRAKNADRTAACASRHLDDHTAALKRLISWLRMRSLSL